MNIRSAFASDSAFDVGSRRRWVCDVWSSVDIWPSCVAVYETFGKKAGSNQALAGDAESCGSGTRSVEADAFGDDPKCGWRAFQSVTRCELSCSQG